MASLFVSSFNALANKVHRTAQEKGWWDKPEWIVKAMGLLPVELAEKLSKFADRNNGEAIALMHSELSEALEAERHDNPPDDKIPDFSGVEAELADVVIRIMDMSRARGWRVAEAIEAKVNFNKTRERMHGGKKF